MNGSQNTPEEIVLVFKDTHEAGSPISTNVPTYTSTCTRICSCHQSVGVLYSNRQTEKKTIFSLFPNLRHKQTKFRSRLPCLSSVACSKESRIEKDDIIASGRNDWVLSETVKLIDRIP